MIFSTLHFLVFFAAFFAVYAALPRRMRTPWLLLASYAFYAFWDFRFLALMAASTVVDYVVALRIAASENPAARRRYLLLSLAVNLSILGFFKYFNFFIDSADALVEALGLGSIDWRLGVVMPVGISFYTFKTLSYTLDVYGRQMEPTRSLVDYAAFVAFFPQLLSGPIDRASALLPQVQARPVLSAEGFRVGAWLFTWGLFKKAVVADNLAGLVPPALAGDASTVHAWVGMYAYALQLYCDFSGYTDMARGVARAMGFETAINFRNPFFATNPVEFWQRWHISLSLWIQDYLYFPMAAAFLRRSRGWLAQFAPHVLTMALIGFWHGAGWSYIFFGLYWGVAIVVYNVARLWLKKRSRDRGRGGAHAAPRGWQVLPRPVGVLFFFHVICLAVVFFRSPTLAEAFRVFGLLAGGGADAGGTGPALLNAGAVMALLCAPVLLVQLLQEKSGDLLAPMRLSFVPRTLLYATLAGMLLALGHTGGQAFIYFQF